MGTAIRKSAREVLPGDLPGSVALGERCDIPALASVRLRSTAPAGGSRCRIDPYCPRAGAHRQNLCGCGRLPSRRAPRHHCDGKKSGRRVLKSGFLNASPGGPWSARHRAETAAQTQRADRSPESALRDRSAQQCRRRVRRSQPCSSRRCRRCYRSCPRRASRSWTGPAAAADGAASWAGSAARTARRRRE